MGKYIFTHQDSKPSNLWCNESTELVPLHGTSKLKSQHVFELPYYKLSVLSFLFYSNSSPLVSKLRTTVTLGIELFHIEHFDQILGRCLKTVSIYREISRIVGIFYQISDNRFEMILVKDPSPLRMSFSVIFLLFHKSSDINSQQI